MLSLQMTRRQLLAGFKAAIQPFPPVFADPTTPHVIFTRASAAQETGGGGAASLTLFDPGLTFRRAGCNFLPSRHDYFRFSPTVIAPNHDSPERVKWQHLHGIACYILM